MVFCCVVGYHKHSFFTAIATGHLLNFCNYEAIQGINNIYLIFWLKVSGDNDLSFRHVHFLPVKLGLDAFYEVYIS